MRYGRLVALLVILSSISLFIGVSNVQLSELLQLDGQSLQILLVTRLPRTIC
ncbi:TPA: ABC transporter permease, partial [Enterococcus faecium]